MATKPKATTTVQDTAGASAAGLKTLCLFGPVPDNADMVPRLFGSAQAAFEYHGFADAIDFMSMFVEQTGNPVLFCGLPISTPGTIGRQNKSGNTGSSVTTVSAGADGVLAEHDGELSVISGGTVGTDQIVIGLSLDGGRRTKRVRLGTATSYTDPYFGFSIAFTVGTLVAGDTIHTWHGTSPRSDSADWATARANLAAQKKAFRSILLIGDLQSDTEAAAYLAQLNAYETANERFIFGRASVYDRLPQAALSHDVVRMVAGTSLTFAEVGASGDTITRASGSWITDGFAVGDTITITDTSSNNLSAVIASLSATVITLGTEDLAAEVTANATVVGRPTLTFAEVGASGDTITRNRGSWITDGFRVGDKIVVTGTASNNITAVQGLATVTALVLTLGTDDLVAEVKTTSGVTVTTGQTKAAWMAEIDAEFASIDDEFRIDLSAGRGAVLQPFSGWNLRRPASWAATLREYQHDLHIAVWEKDHGPTGFDLYDVDGNLAEWDDNVDGEAASAARFTSFRSWSNGPNGAFLTLSLTRAGDDSLLSLTNNVAVLNLACTITQRATENVIGRSLVLKEDGTASKSSLAEIAGEVNAALKRALLVNAENEGQRASMAVWTPSSDDILNVPEATLTGVLDLELNGTIHSVNTKVRVRSGGQ